MPGSTAITAAAAATALLTAAAAAANEAFIHADPAISIALTGTAAAAAATWGVLARRDRRNEAYLDYLADAAYAETQQPEGAIPRWLDQLMALANAATRLTDDQVKRLVHYGQQNETRATLRAAKHAGLLANHIQRMTPDARTCLERAASVSKYAVHAALAVMVRNRLTLDDFHELTQPWVTSRLPIPGGDTCPQFTAAFELYVDDRWTPREPQLVRTTSGESAQQLADRMLHNLLRAQESPIPVPWRLQVWNGPDADTTTPADGSAWTGTVVADGRYTS